MLADSSTTLARARRGRGHRAHGRRRLVVRSVCRARQQRDVRGHSDRARPTRWQPSAGACSGSGCRVTGLPSMRDVDTWADRGGRRRAGARFPLRRRVSPGWTSLRVRPERDRPRCPALDRRRIAALDPSPMAPSSGPEDEGGVLATSSVRCSMSAAARAASRLPSRERHRRTRIEAASAAVEWRGARRYGARAVGVRPLPGEGRWGIVLLLDGNVGIGGGAARLLTRPSNWSGRAGLDGTGATGHAEHLTVRLERAGQESPWFPWDVVGGPMSLFWPGRPRRRPSRCGRLGGRWFRRTAMRGNQRAPRRARRRLLGVALGVCFPSASSPACSRICSSTRAVVPLAGPAPYLYRVTQGLHVATGIQAMPLLLAKLWWSTRSCSPPPVRDVPTCWSASACFPWSVARCSCCSPGSQHRYWYRPWRFDFPAAHYWVAWLTIGALLVHIGAKLTVTREAVFGGGHEDTGARASNGLSRRGFLATVGAASFVLVVTVAGRRCGR